MGAKGAYNGGKDVANGELDEEVGTEGLSSQLCEVTDGANRRVLIPNKAGVLLQSEDCRVADNGLVEDLRRWGSAEARAWNERMRRESAARRVGPGSEIAAGKEDDSPGGSRSSKGG